MEALNPAPGSNQYLTKFGKVKLKKKFKIKVAFATKVKITVCVLLALSLYINWYLLTDNYLWTCRAYIGNVEQTMWGHFGHAMKKSTCDEIVQNKITSLSSGPDLGQ